METEIKQKMKNVKTNPQQQHSIISVLIDRLERLVVVVVVVVAVDDVVVVVVVVVDVEADVEVDIVLLLWMNAVENTVTVRLHQ